MTEIEQDGRTYVLKSEIENIIKDRVSKVAQRASAAETALEDAHKRLEKAEKSMSSVDILNDQLTDLQKKLNAAEGKFSRYQSISKHGLTDPDLVEAIEWSYERAQRSVSDKEKITLSEWLDQQVSSPDKAPLTIRPHLQALQMLDEAPQAQQNPDIAQEQPAPTMATAPAVAPRENVGAIPTPESKGFLDRALKDPDFYAANRDKVVQAWRTRNRRQK